MFQSTFESTIDRVTSVKSFTARLKYRNCYTRTMGHRDDDGRFCVTRSWSEDGLGNEPQQIITARRDSFALQCQGPYRNLWRLVTNTIVDFISCDSLGPTSPEHSRVYRFKQVNIGPHRQMEAEKQ